MAKGVLAGLRLTSGRCYTQCRIVARLGRLHGVLRNGFSSLTKAHFGLLHLSCQNQPRRDSIRSSAPVIFLSSKLYWFL